MLTDDARARVAAMLEEMADLPGFYDRGPLAVNTAGFGGDTPLIVALIRSDLQAALDLLAAGADPSAVGEDDFSAPTLGRDAWAGVCPPPARRGGGLHRPEPVRGDAAGHRSALR